MEAILNKPGNRKSILKGGKVDSPAPKKADVSSPTQAAKTPVKKELVSAIDKTPVNKNAKDGKSPAPKSPAVAAKSPAQAANTPIKKEPVSAVDKTPVSKPAKENKKSPAAAKSPAQVQAANTPNKMEPTPAVNKTPLAKTPVAKAAKGDKSPALKSPAAAVPSPKVADSPKNGAQQPATTPKRMKASDFFDLEAIDEPRKKIKADKTPAKGTPVADKKTPAEKTPKSQKKAAQPSESKTEGSATSPEKADGAPGESKKAKLKAKKAAKKAAAAAAAAADKEKPVKKQSKEEMAWYPQEVVHINRANEARFKAIREKLVAAGKTEEEIAVELPKVYPSFYLKPLDGYLIAKGIFNRLNGAC